jgi:hypothetical protein
LSFHNPHQIKYKIQRKVENKDYFVGKNSPNNKCVFYDHFLMLDIIIFINYIDQTNHFYEKNKKQQLYLIFNNIETK